MFQTFRNAWKIQDLRKKILFTLLIVVLYRLGACIPVPWVATQSLKNAIEFGASNTMFTYINLLSGGAFAQATLFALSVSPYITASIVVQLLTIAIPALERLSKEGEEGQKKIKILTRVITAVLALVTAYGYAMYLYGNGFLTVDQEAGKLTALGVFEIIVIILCFCAGAAIIMWMGEKIDEFGIGNGISTILFANIVSRLPALVETMFNYTVMNKKLVEGAASYTYDGFKTGLPLAIGILVLVGIVVAFVALIYFCVWFTNSERRIPVQYAKRVVGRKMYGGQSSNLPLKMNMAGVMPIIFANSIVTIPATIASFIDAKASQAVNDAFGATSWAYILVFLALNIAFSFFYIMISFNPVEVANNIKDQGGAIPGIRPGRSTIEYIKRILNRVTFVGAIFLCIVAGLPLAANAIYYAITGATLGELAFGGSSLLIIVGVALETAHELEAQMAMRNYKGFLD